MDVWMLLLWIVIGVLVVGGLLKIMLVRRSEVVVEWQAKIAAEKKKQKKK